MIVKHLSLGQFMGHQATELEFPSNGIVLVFGPNGAGKSAVIEGVAVAAWNTTLRGTHPWSSDAGHATVQTDLITAQRELAKSKAKLLWQHADGTPIAKYDTPTKAQAGLEEVIGDQDVWRRTSVFSSQDAAHFTLAADADRKRFMELVLGLDRFDAGSTRARAELRNAERAVEDARTKRSVAQATLDGEAKRRMDAQATLDAMGPEPDLDQLRADVLLAQEEEGDAVDEYDARALLLDQFIAQHRALEQADRAAAAALQKCASGVCPTCEQAWPAVTLEQAALAAEHAHSALYDAKQTYAAESARLTSMAKAALDELTAARARHEEAQRTLRDAQRDQSVRERHQRVLDGVVADEDAVKAKLVALDITLAAAELELAYAQQTDKVLALGGVRSTLLANALSGIETIANTWLGRIAGWGLRLELKPYSEKAGGGVKDKISLEVHGAGGGYGYKASSGGQRRRIDVALLLALSEVAAAAHGQTPGTMFFDEVFDALDSDGVDAVCSVIEELAADRCCVVITHNVELRRRLAPHLVAARWRVTAGEVKVLDPSEPDDTDTTTVEAPEDHGV